MNNTRGTFGIAQELFTKLDREGMQYLAQDIQYILELHTKVITQGRDNITYNGKRNGTI